MFAPEDSDEEEQAGKDVGNNGAASDSDSAYSDSFEAEDPVQESPVKAAAKPKRASIEQRTKKNTSTNLPSSEEGKKNMPAPTGVRQQSKTLAPASGKSKRKQKQTLFGGSLASTGSLSSLLLGPPK